MSLYVLYLTFVAIDSEFLVLTSSLKKEPRNLAGERKYCDRPIISVAAFVRTFFDISFQKTLHYALLSELMEISCSNSVEV